GDEAAHSARDEEGLVHPGERRGAPRLGAARPLLRGMADLPRHRRSAHGHHPRRRRQRMVRAGGVDLRRSRRDLDPLQRGPRLRRGGDADPRGVELGERARRRAVRRRRAGRAVPQRGRRRALAAHRRAARPPVAAALAARRRRADPARAGAAPHGRAPALGRHLQRRRLPHRGWRRHLAAAQQRDPLRLPAGGPALPGIRPVRARAGDGAGHAGPPVPAEPLRHVPERRRRAELAEHRGRPALLLRLPRGGASARPGDAVPAAAERRQRRPLRAG
ncbi:MAG: GH74, partial [uncultured Acetobacteraceae bacterium]